MVKDYIFDVNSTPIRMKLYMVENPKAVMVIVHGMQEHSGRYDEVAKEFNKSNIAVVTSDLRGHGDNISYAPGLDKGNIFLNIVADQRAIIEKVKEIYPNVPVVVLGHSYGSFVTQRLIRDRVNVDKFILSGSSYMKGAIISAGGMVAGISRVFKGREKPANMIEAMSIKGYGKGFEDGNWLSRDVSVWEKYKQDPKCGQVFPVAFYQSMFSELPKNYKKLKNSVGYKPTIFILSGDNDPVGGFSKGVKKLYKTYKNVGFNVSMKLYEGGRHEMLNEINKDEVITDIKNFILN